MKFKYGVLGGTFDRLHAGHKDLLDSAVMQSENLTIGLSTKKIYSRKMLSQIIEPYKYREDKIKEYIRSKNSNINLNIIPLNDVYGTTLEENDFDVIFVTDSTYDSAIDINGKRASLGMRKMEVNKVPLRKDENGEVISSERIRAGEINREGLVYKNVFGKKADLMLPADLRNELRHPIGDVITNNESFHEFFGNGNLVITVGDIVTKTLRENKTPADLEIIDFKTRRSKVDTLPITKSIKHEMISNAPGCISPAAVQAIYVKLRSCIENKSKNQIYIQGEEDLLTLPVILLAPLGSIVLYGQFDLSAMIEVRVTEVLKEKIYYLLKRFK